MVSTHECRCPCSDASPREPVRARPGPAAPRRRDVRGRSRPDPDPLLLQEGGRGLGAGADGRRVGAGLPGVPRRPQHDAWPGEGRHSLPPCRHPGRGQGARDVDDLEVRSDGAAVRRRQGRRHLRSEAPLARREGAPHASLHERDHQRDRPREGHPGARCRHRLPGDGVDLRHVLDERRSLGAGRRHRQAAGCRRLGRPRRRHGPRLALLHPHRAAEAGRAAARHPGRDPGLRERRLQPRAPARRGGRPRDRGLRLAGRDPQPLRPRRAGGDRLQGRARRPRGLPRRRPDHERGADRDRLRRARRRARSSR